MASPSDFFATQDKLQTIDDCSRLPVVKTDRIEIDWAKIDGTKLKANGIALPPNQRFNALFDANDFTTKFPGAEEFSPLSHYVLTAMSDAGRDVPRYGYMIETDRSNNIIDNPDFFLGAHIDAQTEFKYYPATFINGARSGRIVLSDTCSTATLHPDVIRPKCPSAYDWELFYSAILACVRGKDFISLEDNLRGSSIPYCENAEFIQAVHQVTQEILGDKGNYSRYDESCPVIFTPATIHAETGRFLSPSSSEGRPRHRIILTISRPANE